MSGPYWQDPAAGSYGADGYGSSRRGRRGRPEPGRDWLDREAGPGQAAQNLRDRLGVGQAQDVRGTGRNPTMPRARPRPAPGRRARRPDSGRSAPGRSGRDGNDDGGQGRGRDRGGAAGAGGGRRSFREWLLHGSWWRHWTWKKVLGVGAAACAGVVILAFVAFFVAYSRTPLPSDTTAVALAVPSQVYYSDGKPIATFTSGNVSRELIPQSQMPLLVEKAVIAAEDRHFYSEGGISPTGIVRAAYEDIKGGGYAQGGSTITEQFVKNYYTGFTVDNSDKSASTKLKEILVSIKLAHLKSKDWILSQYLNTVYFGQGAYGIGAAAQTYFDRPARDLSVSQAAMLAAMVNQPSYFDPEPGGGEAHTALVQRWRYVLDGMVTDGAITRAKADAITKFPKVHFHYGSNLNGYRGYLMQMVRQELTTTYHLTPAQIDSGGLKIYTTFSQTLMKGLYQAVSQDKHLMTEDGHKLPAYAHVGAVVEQPSTGAIKAIYGGPGYGVRDCAKVYCDLNMAEDPKQVGSSFKPYVLATAVSQYMDVQDSVLNGYSPLWIPEGASLADRLQVSSRTAPVDPDQGYLPFNEAGEDSGPLPVAKAAAISSDPAFEDLAHRVGVQNVIDMAKDFGVGQTPFTQGDGNDWTALNDTFGIYHNDKSTAGSVAIALGEGELTAVEQTSTFATLANDGVYEPPHVIARIVRGSGTIPLKDVAHRVLTPAQAADVDYALSFDNVPGGTAYPDAAWPGRSVIGKTGTTQTAQDAWFLGAVPQYSMGVTLFTNKQDSVSSVDSETLDVLPTLPGNSQGGYGGAWPATIWHTFMLNEFPDLAADALPTPDYTNFQLWNQVTGQSTAQLPSTPTPAPSASQSTCTPAPGQACVPTPTPTPTPTLTTPDPNPSASCTPEPGQFCNPGTPPGQTLGTATTAVTQSADKTGRMTLLKDAAAITVAFL